MLVGRKGARFAMLQPLGPIYFSCPGKLAGDCNTQGLQLSVTLKTKFYHDFEMPQGPNLAWIHGMELFLLQLFPFHVSKYLCVFVGGYHATFRFYTIRQTVTLLDTCSFAIHL